MFVWNCVKIIIIISGSVPAVLSLRHPHGERRRRLRKCSKLLQNVGLGKSTSKKNITCFRFHVKVSIKCTSILWNDLFLFTNLVLNFCVIRCTPSMSAEEMSLRRRIQPFWIALTPQRARRNYIKIITIGFKFQINILSTNEQV